MREAQGNNATQAAKDRPITVGRYVLHREIARGGMATVHIARLMGDEGFDRLVAAKRLHRQLAQDAAFVAMFLEEARVASKIRHRNVVPVLDVVTSGDDVILVQEYVHGVPLPWLFRSLQATGSHVPVRIAVAIACQVLAALHAAHEAVDELGAPLHIVHRDVSPQNVMIAVDGTARLLDFGIAQTTAAEAPPEPGYKGKLAYSAPEQLRGAATRQSDIYSLSVLLWELVVGERLHRRAPNKAELVAAVLKGALPTISEALASKRHEGAIQQADWAQIAQVEEIVRKGLALDARERWSDAAEMERALMAAVDTASPGEVAAWLNRVAQPFLAERNALIASEEAAWRSARVGPDEWGTISSLRSSSIRVRVPAELDVIRIEGERTRPRARAPARRRSSRMAVRAAVGIALATCVAAALMAIAPGDTKPGNGARPAVERSSEAARQSAIHAAATARAPAVSAETPKSEPARAARPASHVTSLPATPAEREGARPKAVSGRPALRANEDEPDANPSRARAASAPSVPARAVAPTVSVSCDPPYYFEGTKKFFKPACL